MDASIEKQFTIDSGFVASLIAIVSFITLVFSWLQLYLLRGDFRAFYSVGKLISLEEDCARYNFPIQSLVQQQLFSDPQSGYFPFAYAVPLVERPFFGKPYCC